MQALFYENFTQVVAMSDESSELLTKWLTSGMLFQGLFNAESA